MPTDNPLADPAMRQAIRQNIDDIRQDRSHVVRDLCQDVLDALRLLEAVMDICIADGWRGGAVEDYLRERLPERERLADRIAALEQERGALRKLVREAFEEGANAVGGPPFFSQHLQDQWWEASATKRTMEKESK